MYIQILSVKSHKAHSTTEPILWASILHKTLINKDTVTHMDYSLPASILIISCFFYMMFCFVRPKSLFTQSGIPVDLLNAWWMSRISANGLNGCWVISHWCRQTHWVCSSQWVSKSPWSHRDPTASSVLENPSFCHPDTYIFRLV